MAHEPLIRTHTGNDVVSQQHETQRLYGLKNGQYADKNSYERRTTLRPLESEVMLRHLKRKGTEHGEEISTKKSCFRQTEARRRLNYAVMEQEGKMEMLRDFKRQGKESGTAGSFSIRLCPKVAWQFLNETLSEGLSEGLSDGVQVVTTPLLLRSRYASRVGEFEKGLKRKVEEHLGSSIEWGDLKGEQLFRKVVELVPDDKWLRFVRLHVGMDDEAIKEFRKKHINNSNMYSVIGME